MENNDTSGGDGGDDLIALTDTRRVRSDARMVARAIRQGWGVSATTRQVCVDRLHQIVARQSVPVPTHDGSGMDDRVDIADAHAISAARVLATIDQIDQTDHWASEKNERLDAGLATERVGSEPVVLRQAISPQAIDAIDAIDAANRLP